MNNHIKGNIRKVKEEINARCHILRALLDMFQSKLTGKKTKSLVGKRMEEQIDAIEGLEWVLEKLEKQ